MIILAGAYCLWRFKFREFSKPQDNTKGRAELEDPTRANGIQKISRTTRAAVELEASRPRDRAELPGAELPKSELESPGINPKHLGPLTSGLDPNIFQIRDSKTPAPQTIPMEYAVMHSGFQGSAPASPTLGSPLGNLSLSALNSPIGLGSVVG